VAAAWLAALAGMAEARTEVRFTRTVELPDVGLQIRLMSDARQEPVPPAVAQTYEVRQGTNQWKSDLFDPMDLWRRDQCAGVWSDEHGNRVVLAVIQDPVPPAFARAHVTPDEYKAWQRQAAARGAAAVPADDVAAWAARFLGADGGATAEPVGERGSNLRSLTAYRVAGRPAGHLVYAFTVARSPSSQRSGAPTRFLIAFELKPDVDVERTRAALLRSFFPYVQGTAAVRPAAAPASATRPPERGRAARPAPSPEWLASREEAAASVRNLKGWWVLELPNFMVLSNLKTRRHGLIERLESDLELLRGLYAGPVPARAPITAVSVVRVFDDPADYERYVGPDYTWSSGLWVPERRELLVRPGDLGTNREQRERILRTVYHEAFHQYLYYAFDRLAASAWFNEGYAAVFENAEVREGKVSLEEDPGRVPVLESLIAEGRVELWTLLHMPYPVFYARDEKTMAENYALAWGLVYYLRRGAPLQKPPAWPGLLERYADELWKTRDPDRATDAAFADVDPTEFTRQFQDFWKSAARRSLARRAPVLP
jgi:hypothetical protein